MRIKVEYDKGKRILIPFPSCLIFNPLSCAVTLWIVNIALRKNGIAETNISLSGMCRLSREIMRYRRRHPGWKLVEVDTSSGEKVLIKL